MDAAEHKSDRGEAIRCGRRSPSLFLRSRFSLVECRATLLLPERAPSAPMRCGRGNGKTGALSAGHK
eukprot:5306065-Pyramimonas_sp.AAC.1